MTPASLVLLPGLDGTGELFAPLLAELPPSIAPIVVRYPVDRRLGYDALLSIARAALPVGRPFVLVGESFSGPLAIRLAAAHPVGLRALVLVASFHRRPVAPWIARLRPLLPLAFALPPPGAAVRHLLTGPGASASLIAACAAAVGSVRPGVLAARVRDALDVDVSDELARVQVPVSYLAASSDALLRRGGLDELRALVPRLEVHRFACAHLVLQRCPRESARVLIELATRG
ncbi:MAG: alpha/beta hydrolase [Myxococcota bacterium]|nr:alpha/beta hydrolase [Myxococcota bacterium]